MMLNKETKEFQMTAKTFHGLEEVLALELKKLELKSLKLKELFILVAINQYFINLIYI